MQTNINPNKTRNIIIAVVAVILLAGLLYWIFTSKEPAKVKGEEILDYKYEELQGDKKEAKKELESLFQVKTKDKEAVVTVDNRIELINKKHKDEVKTITLQSADADFEFLSKWLSKADTLRK